ncbi:MAG: universal stress protein, partial [Candidatus Rokuibacteriota bacterium]
LTARPALRTGAAHREVVALATDERADLIVIGTHGRGGVDRALLGSVADRVVRLAPCPVLTVREGA